MSATKLNHVEKNIPVEAGEKHLTIVLYSPDMDFCFSLRLLLQDRYNMVTITDHRMLLMTVRDFKADLVIVDSVLTDKMVSRFEAMKRENPQVRILLFYVSRFDDKRVHDFIRQSVDEAFSKPIDLTEVTESIHELMAQEPGTTDVSLRHNSK